MDICPRCRSADRVERAGAITASGAQPLGGLLSCPPPPPMPAKIKAYRICIAVGAVGTLGAVASTGNAQSARDPDAAWFGSLILPFAVVLVIVGLVLMWSWTGLRRQWAAARRVHQVTRQLWPLLDYCHRCDVVFLAGGSFATEPVHTAQFLWDAADHTLRAHSLGSPPGQ